MNTIQLECFLAVSENLNFARAAEQLHITQPAVTHQIHSLETELNTRLFVRTTRSVELTPAGFAFISDASDILGRTRAAKARFSGGNPGQISEFFIGCLGLPEQNLLPPVLRNLKKDRHFCHTGKNTCLLYSFPGTSSCLQRKPFLS